MSQTHPNPLIAPLESWWAGPISWKVMLLLVIALLYMFFLPIIGVVGAALLGK